MKTLYIFLTRSGTLVSNLVYALTGAEYTHISLAFDEDLNTLYSSTRKNGYTMFPAGPSREYLNKGVFRLRENIPCALYALEVSDEAYARAKRRAEHMMSSTASTRWGCCSARFISAGTAAAIISAPSSSARCCRRAARWTCPSTAPSCAPTITPPCPS